jgi:hypothetical protein
VAIDQDNRIYAGAQSEVGYFYPGPDGVLRYTSLIACCPPDHRSFEDVWDIVFYEGLVFFRTNRSVFEYTGEAMKIHSMEGDLQNLFTTPQGLFLQHDNRIFLFLKMMPFSL